MPALLSAQPRAAQARPNLRLVKSSPSAELPQANPKFRHPRDTHQVFFVQRTTNANTIVYAARFGADGNLDRHRPMTGYWRRYAGAGEVMAFRWYERVFAFGLRFRPGPDGEGYLVSWNALRDQSVHLRQSGPFQAALWTRYDNRDFQLIYGYLDLDESGVLPRVERLRLYTREPAAGRFVTHLIAVSGGEYQE